MSVAFAGSASRPLSCKNRYSATDSFVLLSISFVPFCGVIASYGFTIFVQCFWKCHHTDIFQLLFCVCVCVSFFGDLFRTVAISGCSSGVVVWPLASHGEGWCVVQIRPNVITVSALKRGARSFLRCGRKGGQE